MKYLSLNNEELKELINLKKGNFISYLTVTFSISIISYFIFDWILIDNTAISAMSIVFIISSIFLIIFFYLNRSYFHDLLKKEKKVYTGVLSTKTEKIKADNKYQFNMDGNIFIVDKETFEKFNVGDIVEFHISSFTKHLFKVEKRNELA